MTDGALDAGARKAALDNASRELRAATTIDEVDRLLRRVFGSLTGRIPAVRLRDGYGGSVESAREVADGLLAAVARNPDLRLRAAVTQVMSDRPDVYTIAKVDAQGDIRLFVNGYWLDSRRRDELASSLAADGRRGGPDNLGALVERQVLSAPTRPGEYPASRQRRRENALRIGNPAAEVSARHTTASSAAHASALEAHRHILLSRDPRDIERHLAAALRAALGHEVEVGLAYDTDVETAREVADGLIRTALADPGNKLSGVHVKELHGDEREEFAVTRLRADGSSVIEFNRRFHREGARDLFLDKLAAVRSIRQSPPRTAAEVAALRMHVPGTGPLTLRQRRDRIARAHSLSDVEEHLRAALRATVGHAVAVDLHGAGRYVTDLESAKDIATGLITASEHLPGADVREVTVGRIKDPMVYARATTKTDGGTTITFSAQWHSQENRQTYLESLKSTRKREFHTGATPAEVAIHEYAHALSSNMPGWRAPNRVPGHEDGFEPEVRTRSGRPKAPWRILASQVSWYAIENHEELTAEAFVDVLRNGRDAVSVVSRTVYDRLRAAHIHFARQRGALSPGIACKSTTKAVEACTTGFRNVRETMTGSHHPRDDPHSRLRRARDTGRSAALPQQGPRPGAPHDFGLKMARDAQLG